MKVLCWYILPEGAEDTIMIESSSCFTLKMDFNQAIHTQCQIWDRKFKTNYTIRYLYPMWLRPTNAQLTQYLPANLAQYYP